MKEQLHKDVCGQETEMDKTNRNLYLTLKSVTYRIKHNVPGLAPLFYVTSSLLLLCLYLSNKGKHTVIVI